MIGDDDLRDCFAMFAMMGLFMKGIGLNEESAKQCWDAADLMIETKYKKEPEVGIVAVKSRRKK
jgi:hypothetical protein